MALTEEQESHDCGAWYDSLIRDRSGALRPPTLSVFKDGREIFGPRSDGQTTILHISSLEVRRPLPFDRDSLIDCG